MSVNDAVHRATSSRSLQWVARAGYPVSGLLHLLIGYIILRIAFGLGGDADQTGALATVGRTGAVSLWIVAFGLFALALWRLAETFVGLRPGEREPDDPDDTAATDRLKALGLAVLYCALAFTAVQFALGAVQRGSERSVGLSARMMQSVAGTVVLVLIGMAVVAVGGYYVYKGAAKKFIDDLTVPGGPVVIALGVFGHVAEGLVLAGAGVLVVSAALTSDPSQAAGLDGAVKALGQEPFGTAVMIAAALGFAAHGLYTFTLTRYARM
ncbi:DUF1206 domain-containing protein [Mycolicibacterium thermoresistibile]